MTLEVGGQVLELEYHGVNHEPGNLFIYAPAQKILMLVDVIFPGWVPFKDLALAEDVPGYFEAHEQVLAYDFMAIGQEVGFNNAWVLFDTYLDAVAQTCADQVEAEWVGKLGGADVFTFDHCFKTMESLRID